MSERPDEPFDVRSLALTYRAGHAVMPHRHGWAQLLHARSGLMRVVTGDQLWLIPPTRALWIPANVEHRFTVQSETSFRSLYIDDKRSADIDRGLGALQVTPLFGELILYIMSLAMLDPRDPHHDRLAGLLVDLIRQADAIDTLLPLPRDGPARRLAEQLQNHPGDARSLEQMSRAAGLTLRTTERQFKADTGMTLDQWRQKARLIASTAALLSGQDVTTTALDHGYASPSAFGAAFKRQFGMTPRNYVRLDH
jgi:AraC-like DNA-binding protein